MDHTYTETAQVSAIIKCITRALIARSPHRLPKLTRILLQFVLSNDFVLMFSGINLLILYIIWVLHIRMIY